MIEHEDIFEKELQISKRIKHLYIQSLKSSLRKVLVELNEIESLCGMNETNYNLFNRELLFLEKKKKNLEKKLQYEQY